MTKEVKADICIALIGTILELASGKGFTTLDEFDAFKSMFDMIGIDPEKALYETNPLILFQRVCRIFADMDISDIGGLHDKFSEVNGEVLLQ